MQKEKGIGLKYALNGIFIFFRRESNAKIHLIVSVFVVFFGFYFRLTVTEWLWLLVSIALVFITEMLNSAIEILCDMVTTEYHEKAKRLKDISAGAVLIAAMFAITVGVIIFKDYIAGYFD